MTFHNVHSVSLARRIDGIRAVRTGRVLLGVVLVTAVGLSVGCLAVAADAARETAGALTEPPAENLLEELEELTEQPVPEAVPDKAPPDEVVVPVLGRLSVRRLGMPAFAFLIGLVVGFNSCAVWVLVLLLCILVILKDRW